MKHKSTEGYLTSPLERGSYWLYYAGQAFSYALLVMLLPTYLMMVGVDVTKIAGAMLVVKIWDALNDTIFGIIFDKIKFKSGKKCIPWLRITVYFMPAASLFMYLIPSGLSETFKLVWFVVAYILWDTAYTLSDVPIYTLVTSMTNNLKERNHLLTVARIFAGGGSGAFMLATVLISEKVGLTFPIVAFIICAGMVITMLPIILTGKERIQPEVKAEESYSFKTMLKYLKTNKHLLYFFSGYILTGTLNTAAALELFVSYYLFGSALFSTLLLIIATVPMLIVVLCMNKLLERFDKFKLYYACLILNVILGLILYFVGYHNIVIYIIIAILRAFPLTITGILSLTFTPDCVEYGQYKTGIDARGIAFAIQSFAAKFSSISQSIGLFVLGLFGWVTIKASNFAELEQMNIAQTPTALNGLWFTYALIPVIGAALALIPYFFYKLNDKDVQIMAKCNTGEITKEEAEAMLSRKY